MENRQGKTWERYELILAFDLYCKTPFGKISSSNKNIQELAKLLGRTPGSIALKMSNLAHFDPILQARGIKGMKNGNKLDPLIFNEFKDNLEELANQAEKIREQLSGMTNNTIELQIEVQGLPPGEYRDQVVRVRLGQNLFRQTVLNSYYNRCCITGLSEQKLLIASHIKPWAQCDENTERTNPTNGLCLNAFHDRAFDQGYITIDLDYKIQVSSKLMDAKMDEETKDWLKYYNHREIELPEKFAPSKEFLQYHNDVIFIP